MAKKIEVVGPSPKRIDVVGKPKRRVEPVALAAGLGANPLGQKIFGDADPIALAEIGTQLLRRLRSTGGRPALVDATEICRVPLSAGDLRILEIMVAQVGESTGGKPSVGQLVSVIVRSYLAGLGAGEAIGNLGSPVTTDTGETVAAWSSTFPNVPNVNAVASRARAVAHHEMPLMMPSGMPFTMPFMAADAD